MSNVPLARAMFDAIVAEWQDKLEAEKKMLANMTRAIALLFKEPPLSRAKPKNRLTQAIADKIRAYRKAHPEASVQEIASAVGINNMCRVSEVLHGKRFPKSGK